jgi:uncharacterized protein YcbK (DUF882 family)
MGDLSENFSRSEFACGCSCGMDTCDSELLRWLEIIREHFCSPVRVTSGFRCNPHNTSVGGGANSQHLYGRAADITVDGVDPLEVAQFAEHIGVPGVGTYAGWVHIDSRSHAVSRWAG